MPLLGAHVSSAGGLPRAVERAVALGCETFQLFTHNPLQWRGASPTPAAVDEFRRALIESGIKRVTAHASYLINLAGEGSVLNKSVDAMIYDIELCFQLGIDSLVVHPGSSKNGPRDEALTRLAASLDSVLERTRDKNVSILLETMSGQGGAIGAVNEELEGILDALAWDGRLGICADICHVFGAGADVRTKGGYARFVAALDKHFGLDRIGCWHLSDNKGTLGSGVDRHQHIGEGEIGLTPFGMLVSDDRFVNTPMIIETPKDGIGDEGNLAILRKLRGSEKNQ
ncbi:MAG: deoxyribonuclease IV [Synergistaceae bacterium]|jgi:deoxyribonuclease-4|nr:deoxyribonuclease IV [Synergistaceae bacterium]